MEHPIVPTLLMKIYKESGMAPPRCSGDHSHPCCRNPLRIGRGKSRAPVLPRVAGRLLPAPASVVADPVMEPVAVLPHAANSAGLSTPPQFQQISSTLSTIIAWLINYFTYIPGIAGP